MTRIVIHRLIQAPLDRVFTTVSHVAEFRKAIPQIVKVEYLSHPNHGVGARFRETRIFNGKPEITELRVTEYVPNDYIRLKATKHGILWDTVFAVRAENDLTRLTMVLDAKAYELLPQLMNPLWSPMLRKAAERDMDAVKSFCESTIAVPTPR